MLFEGLILGLDYYEVSQGEQKTGCYLLAREVLVPLFAANAGFRHPSDQVEGKAPKALALATACVRLWTLSLP